ncbi:MAG: hypothetical protein K6F07_02940 [Bacilli bacterium]|nr:hypothetical protein [Bacilli bacterium]
MKLNSIFLAGFCIPFLLGCTTKSSYNGAKIVLKYVENGALVTVTPDDMYNMTVTNKESNIFILGNDNCGSCKSAKNTLSAYSQVNHCNTYYVNIKNITTAELTTIQKATAGNYMFGEKDSVPAIYFMYQGDVAFRTGDSELTNYLETYVEVAKPTSSVDQ